MLLWTSLGINEFAKGKGVSTWMSYLQKITGEDIMKAYNTPDKFTHQLYELDDLLSCYHALISGCNWVSCSLAFGCHVAHLPLWPAKWPNINLVFFLMVILNKHTYEINSEH